MFDPRLAEEQALELAEIFRMLGDANRLRIAVVCLGEPLCVSAIAEQVRLSPDSSPTTRRARKKDHHAA